MPRRNSLISRLRHGRAWDEWDEKDDGETVVAPVPAPVSSTPRSRRRRIAVAVVFGTLFVTRAAWPHFVKAGLMDLDEALAGLEQARGKFRSVSLDLIYALPGQSAEAWRAEGGQHRTGP